MKKIRKILERIERLENLLPELEGSKKEQYKRMLQRAEAELAHIEEIIEKYSAKNWVKYDQVITRGHGDDLEFFQVVGATLKEGKFCISAPHPEMAYAHANCFIDGVDVNYILESIGIQVSITSLGNDDAKLHEFNQNIK